VGARLGLKGGEAAAARRDEQGQAGDAVVVGGLDGAVHLVQKVGARPVARVLRAQGGEQRRERLLWRQRDVPCPARRVPRAATSAHLRVVSVEAASQASQRGARRGGVASASAPRSCAAAPRCVRREARTPRAAHARRRAHATPSLRSHQQMRSASFGSQPQRSVAWTGFSLVPCALADMMLSWPTMGSLAPGATGAPLQPSDRPSGAEDAMARRAVTARARRGRLPEAGSEVQRHAARTDDSMDGA
jgi:hypothetical protein